jgi:hypothetical protein
MVTTEYCVPGPLRILSNAGTTQYLSPVGVGDGLSVLVGVGSCTWVEVGTSVGLEVTVAVAVDELPQADNRTIKMVDRRRNFILHTPLIE